MTDDDHDDTPRTHTVTDSERLALPRTAFEAKLDERMDAAEREIASLTASRRMWRWIAGLGAPVILSALFGLVIYSADKIAANAERVGGTAAEIKSLGRQIESLEGEIKELRAVLLKISGISGMPITFVQYRGDLNDSPLLHLALPVRRFLFAYRADPGTEVRVRPNLLDEPRLQ